VDFDLSGETTRSIDLVNTALHWVPLCDPADRGPAFADVDAGHRLRLLYDAYGRDHFTPEHLLAAAELRFADAWTAMRWRAQHYGGGWARMWDEGIGDVIDRRISWFDELRAVLEAQDGPARSTN
jgi:hypothetical protein